jgi:predicted enzyme related to lactoylglutathione lyase
MTSKPTQPSSPPWNGRFVWHDLMTKDAARAKEFYSALFQWSFETVPMGTCDYHMILAGPGPIGGIVETQEIPVPHWMPYCAVPDVDATAARCATLGGKIYMPPSDIPETGRFAVVADPQGGCFSIYKGLPQSAGADPDAGIPGRVCWNELMTSDPDAAAQFYGKLLGWVDKTEDMGPIGIYHLQMQGEVHAGGIMRSPAPMPPAWLVYFLVEDLAASTKKAKSLGAQALMENTPIPGVGTFSLIVDPTGAHLALFKGK